MARLFGRLVDALRGAALSAFLDAKSVGLAGFELFNRFRQSLSGRGFSGTSAEIGELFRRARGFADAGSVLEGAAADETLLLRDIPLNRFLPDFLGESDRIVVEALVTVEDGGSGVTDVQRIFLNFAEPPSRGEVDAAIANLIPNLAGSPKGPLVGFSDPGSISIVDIEIVAIQRRF